MSSPVKFLLVDDLPENLLSLEALLRRDDLTLLKARSGDEALELLLEHDVALALLDVQMPGLNGFELAELMRGNERTRRIPIIFVTAGAHSETRRFQGYEAGAVDFIQKPIEADILRSKTDVFFEIYRQRQTIAEQRDMLQSHANALQLADRRKDEFLAVLAHELRNPLAALNGGLKLLARRPEGSQAEKVTELMEDQITHLVRLVDDLMDVSRITQGKIELQKSQFDLRDTVSAAISMAAPNIEAKNHHVQIRVPVAPVMAFADEFRITQCLANLVNNAAKYTPEGGNIEVGVADDEGELKVWVADDGLGLSSNEVNKIFEMFSQIDTHLQHSKGGLGIGLALVKQLIELHGGKVFASSAGVGQGTTFTVILPQN
ncbi:hybrid sensor histidine kinase/response regulator [Agrobacterium rubi]|uniref:hybrid sensor histidine kinase/response regulator n=1 Tax=Agrobacterium rubi TaxID=28099 RepID=UPI001572882F|nr:hybrid sensor histidine kinase/response regulator [Agrobacterium rubi]NTF10725.1 hybrid sensor histidine kinase/response regulator [Agrobacterium rubi]NTF23118.1 hybrid sensor histidine kinase/response regulator [Agrobacterium rubi]NTF30049.1 hybrid sensor histidine kinase/response regulator [Agrobacterium rubi]